MMKTPTQRFQEKVVVLANGCWEWSATVNVRSGYPIFYDHGAHSVRAHRWAYEAWIGPIPDDKQLDHMCHDPYICSGGFSCPHRRCVNPLHLALSDPAENLARRSSVVVTHCPQGHAYEGDNLYVSKAGTRMCLECNRTRAREYQRRKRAQYLALKGT